jgi:hypothetical protein
LRRIALVFTVALIIVAMLAMSALPAMASMGADASDFAACNQGTENAHTFGVAHGGGEEPTSPTLTAHENIPECEM